MTGTARMKIALARLLIITLFKWYSGGLEARGTDNIPPSGPVIICPNHISDSDPAAIVAACQRNDIAFVGKRELFDMKGVRNVVRFFETIPIERESADRKALRHMEAVLAAGNVLVIFPEGQISQTGNPQPIHGGACYAAVRTMAPIVPTHIVGTNAVLRYAATKLEHTKRHVQITFKPAITPDTWKGMGLRAAVGEIARQLEATIFSDQPS
jgi:1-acyl-sn-glycerol-3-phosphate acyltransferase